MTNLKAVVSRRHLLLFMACAFLLVLNVLVYARDAQGIETALSDAIFASLGVVLFWAIWSLLNTDICRPNVTRSRVFRSMVIPVIVLAALLLVRFSVANGTRLFAVTDFTFNLMTLGLLLTVQIMDITWRMSQKVISIAQEH